MNWFQFTSKDGHYEQWVNLSQIAFAKFHGGHATFWLAGDEEPFEVYGEESDEFRIAIKKSRGSQ